MACAASPRCVARERHLTIGPFASRPIAGPKVLRLLEADGHRRFRFRADMGPATQIAQRTHRGGRRVRRRRDAAGWGTRRQWCSATLDEARTRAARARASSSTPCFPTVSTWSSPTSTRADRVRILIWERGVGPTRSSGTGSCAAAVAAAVAGGAARTIDVVAPGGTQRVEWTRRRRVSHRLGRGAVRSDVGGADADAPGGLRVGRDLLSRRGSSSIAGAGRSGSSSRRCVFVAVLLLPMRGLAAPAHRMAAIMAHGDRAVGHARRCRWRSTAMLGPLLAIVLGVAPARAALASFADPIIFLFIGSFMLAEAMFVHGVDRRIAYTALSWRAVGTSASRILLVYGGVATAALDVDQQHRDHGDDVSDRAVDRRRTWPDGPQGRSGRRAQVRDGDDADHLLRRVGRRHGHAGRHAAEPDRHRHARAHRRSAHITSSSGWRSACRSSSCCSLFLVALLLLLVCARAC